MALRVTAQEWLDKHARNLTNALPDIRRGIERVTEAPGQKAAAAQDKMQQNLVESIQSGRWASRVAAVSLPEWKQAALDKGLNRIAGGVEASKTKNRPKIERLLSTVDAVKSSVDGMPKNTFQDSIARMNAFVTGMHEAKLRGDL